jgi:hypothetical protein
MRERVDLVGTYLSRLWQRMTVTRYARALEEEAWRQRAEIARLRAENRALLNSILGIAGIPPIVVQEAEIERAGSGGEAGISEPADSGSEQRATANGGRGAPKPPRAPGSAGNGRGQGNGIAGKVAGMRRRSWHQINRMLEIESARKPERARPSDTRAPTP